VGLSSYDKSKMKLNDDGTVDIYFGKTAPKGLKSNWISDRWRGFLPAVPVLRTGEAML
jgi:hypothetical protein